MKRLAAAAAAMLALACGRAEALPAGSPAGYAAVSPTEAVTADDASGEGFIPGPPPEAGTRYGRVRVSGRYRLAAGADDEDFILNESNADLQERNFRYVSGERLENTFDSAIYSQYRLDVDADLSDTLKFHTRFVADPWSWVGTTGEQITRSDIGVEEVRYNLKYFGAFNSTLNEAYRSNTGDAVGFPLIKVQDGHTTQQTVRGFFDFNPATGGVPFTIPELDVDYEFRPFRELWVDSEHKTWHARFFALADESQALSTDDPLQLSNHRDYWQQSPWLYQYQPIRFFSDGSFKRGYYSDSLSYLARDSEGHRLVLLRGASVEATTDRTYFAATVAAPYTPWDEEFFSGDNVPAAARLKHRVTDRLTVGSTYTYRAGMINNSVTDLNQVIAIDAKHDLNEHVVLKSEFAYSYEDREIKTDVLHRASKEGYAYQASADAAFPHKIGETEFKLGFTQMDRGFNPNLSRYTDTRDDPFWGKHLSFTTLDPGLEPFRLGDGVDVNRFVVRAQWKEKLWKGRFENLFDVRNVHKAEDMAFKENVLREEMTWKVNGWLTAKAMFRWHRLPETTTGQEPFISDYYFIGFEDPSNLQFQNVAIPPDKDPSRFTYAAALQAVLNPQWTAEGFVERTNDLSDFPRGLLNSTFRDANDRVDGLLLDHLTNFLYGQGPLGGVPPYEYFTITRERLIWKPDPRVTVTFHAAQNGTKYAGGIDDNVNHQGVGVAFSPSKKWTFFADYTHSNQIDLANLVASNYTVHDFEDHHNVYASLDYRLNSATVFRAEYGAFGLGSDAPVVTPYSVTTFSLPTVDTEHLLRVSLTGDF